MTRTARTRSILSLLLALLLLGATTATPAPVRDFTEEEKQERLARYAGFTSNAENCVDRTAETLYKLGGWATIVISSAEPVLAPLGQAVGSLMLAFPPDHLCFCKLLTVEGLAELESGGDNYTKAVIITVRKFFCVRNTIPRSKLLTAERPCYHPQPDLFPGWVITPDGPEDECW